jgi:hypothetical protein
MFPQSPYSCHQRRFIIYLPVRILGYERLIDFHNQGKVNVMRPVYGGRERVRRIRNVNAVVPEASACRSGESGFGFYVLDAQFADGALCTAYGGYPMRLPAGGTEKGEVPLAVRLLIEAKRLFTVSNHILKFRLRMLNLETGEDDVTTKEVERAKCKRLKLNLAGEEVQCENWAGNNCEGYCRKCFNDIKMQLPPYSRAVERRVNETEAKKLFDKLMRENNVAIETKNFDEELNPLEALLEMANEQVAWKNLCLAKLAKLQEDEWRWDGDRAGEQIRSEIVMYERAIDRATNTLIKISRLGIEAKLAQIAEKQVSIVETAIVRTLQDIGLDIDTQAKARTRIIKHLKSA